MQPETSKSKPSIIELGTDLLSLSRFQLFITLTAPLFFFALYFVFAFYGYWPVAIVSAMALSFSTYGSTSHDLVHENLKINRTFNSFLLSFTEALCFRSGHAYKLSHLYHHKRYPLEDDVEGAASRMTFLRSLLEGVIFQFKIYAWSITGSNSKGKYRNLIITEGIVISLLIAGSLYVLQFTFIPFVYLGLMISGSWIIPLITSYAVHTPYGANELLQTRLFRGKFFSVIAFDHLYHLEHHLYPMVPHKNWPKLAQRLDYYFERHGVKPVEIGTKKREVSNG